MAPDPKTYTVTLIGPPQVGKSALINRFVVNHFSIEQDHDEALDINTHRQVLVDGVPVMVDILPSRGLSTDESFDRLCYFVSKSSITLLVCDLNSRQTVDVVEDVYHRIRKMPGGRGRRVQMAIVATKSDELKEKEMNTGYAELLAGRLGIPYVLTSAKESIGVDDAFVEPLRVLTRTKTPDLKRPSQKEPKPKKADSGGWLSKLLCCGLGVVDQSAGA